MAVPKLAMIPSGYKAGKLYSILPTDGTGDFTVTRNSTATRINSAGLIETVGVNVPRLDYPTIGGCPELLVEPQSTNLITYSEDFSNISWTKDNINITTNHISPSGLLDAYRLVEDVTSSNHQLFVNFVTGSPTTNYTTSFFVKYYNKQFIRLSMSGNCFSTPINVWFDLLNGNKGTSVGPGILNYDIIKLYDGWFKIYITATSDSSGNQIFPLIALSNSNGDISSYLGDGVSGVYVWGATTSQSSSISSYIKTSGVQVTRLADVITVTPPAGSTTITETVGGTDFVRTFATPYTVTNNRIQKITMI